VSEKVKYRTGFASSSDGYPKGSSEKKLPIKVQKKVETMSTINKSGNMYPVMFGKFFMRLVPPSGIVEYLFYWPCQSAHTRSFSTSESVGIAFNGYDEFATGQNLLHHSDVPDPVHVFIPN
jgi:hypothetical protein